MQWVGSKGNPPGVACDQIKVRGMNVVLPALRSDTCTTQCAVQLASQPVVVLLLSPALGVASEVVNDGQGAGAWQLGSEDSLPGGPDRSVGENI
jgi:hypothetical protein